MNIAQYLTCSRQMFCSACSRQMFCSDGEQFMDYAQKVICYQVHEDDKDEIVDCLHKNVMATCPAYKKTITDVLYAASEDLPILSAKLLVMGGVGCDEYVEHVDTSRLAESTSLFEREPTRGFTVVERCLSHIMTTVSNVDEDTQPDSDEQYVYTLIVMCGLDHDPTIKSRLAKVQRSMAKHLKRAKFDYKAFTLCDSKVAGSVLRCAEVVVGFYEMGCGQSCGCLEPELLRAYHEACLTNKIYSSDAAQHGVYYKTFFRSGFDYGVETENAKAYCGVIYNVLRDVGCKTNVIPKIYRHEDDMADEEVDECAIDDNWWVPVAKRNRSNDSDGAADEPVRKVKKQSSVRLAVSLEAEADDADGHDTEEA